MGIETNKDKIVTITGNDNIEISNLNRQFLFKHDNIGKHKSIIASKEEIKMNTDFHCNLMKVRIGLVNENFLMKNFGKNKILA